MARKIVGLSKAEAQKIVVREIAKGSSVSDAMKFVDRSVQTYENWRAIDPEFKEAINKARGRKARAEENGFLRSPKRSKKPFYQSLTAS